MLTLREGWARRRANDHPYRWMSTAPGELMSEAQARGLAHRFPTDRFTRRDASRRVGDKRYRNESRPVVVDGALVADDLYVAWRELVADLTSVEYRETVAAVLGQEVAQRLEIRLVRHGTGDWLGPHTDREDKLFSHILYFNEGWVEEWGGCLEILEDDDPSSVVGRVVPTLGSSALLAQAPNSWHQVTKVRGTPPDNRRSVLVHGLSERRIAS